MSTGELGVMLATRLAAAGAEVTCFKGSGAVEPGPEAPVLRVPFTTNADLLERLEAIPNRDQVAAVFHAAALCDYRVSSISASGERVSMEKIATRAGALTLTLEPAPKVLNRLRSLFPTARIVGWKYELVGSPEEVVEQGGRQMRENATDACIVNGSAYGTGFGFVAPEREIVSCSSKAALCEFLVGWIAEKVILHSR